MGRFVVTLFNTASVSESTHTHFAFLLFLLTYQLEHWPTTDYKLEELLKHTTNCKLEELLKHTTDCKLEVLLKHTTL